MSIGRRIFSPSIVLPLLSAILAIYPLLPPGIPSTADGPLHLIRDVEFDAVLRSGVLYPRWAPDLAYGYGYPLFNFYAPLFYYLAEIPHLLGASFELALKLTIFLTFVLYGFGAYWWTRPFLGDAAAVVGVAYVYIPLRFHEAYMQGDYPQFLAMAIAPFALGAVSRLFAADRVTFRHIAMLTLALAAILLVHNISALWLAPTLAGYALVLGIGVWGPGFKDRGNLRRALSRLSCAAGTAVLALGLTAYFWLPALAEQNLVQLYRLRTDDYNVRHSFITLATLLAPPSVVDQRAANPPPFLHLGWGQLALALATIPLLILFIRVSVRKSAHALSSFPKESQTDRPGKVGLESRPALVSQFLYGWLLLLSSAAMTLSFSTPVWRMIPLIAYTQFPWRLLELSGIATALLAGIAVYLVVRLLNLNRGWRGAGIVGIALIGLLVPSLVYLYPRHPFLVYGHMTAASVTGFERNGGAVGTTSTGEYYPMDVRNRPTAPLPKNLPEIGRLDRTTLPHGARVSFLGSAGYEERYALTLPESATLRFDLIRFAGWQVAIDGRTVATRSSPGQGLLLVDVPAGSHRLTLNFVDTPVRRLGWTLAWVSVIVFLALGLMGLIRKRVPPDRAKKEHSMRKRGSLARLVDGSSPRDSASPNESLAIPDTGTSLPSLTLDRRGVVALGAGFLGLIALRVTSPAPYAAVFARKSPLNRVIGVSHPALVRLEDKVEFLGYDLSTAMVRPGDSLSVTLYWRALRPLMADYRSLAMIARVGDQGLLAQDDRVNPGDVPTDTWPVDRYFIDEHTIAIPTDAPPMVYQLQVALYNSKTLKHLQEDGVSGWQGQQIVLQQLHVTRPVPVDPSTYHSLGNPVFGGQITLVGYRISSQTLRPGQSLELTLIWKAEEPLDLDYTVFAHLVDAQQKQVAGNDSVPVHGQYPTSTWLVGEEVVDPHPMVLPPNLATGQYHLAFGMYDSKTLQRLEVTRKGWNGPRSQIDLNALPIHVGNLG